MNKAEKISNSQLEEISSLLISQFQVDTIEILKLLSEIKEQISFLKIYSSRKLQLANFLYNFCKYSQSQKQQYKREKSFSNYQDQTHFQSFTKQIHSAFQQYELDYIQDNQYSVKQREAKGAQLFYSKKFFQKTMNLSSSSQQKVNESYHSIQEESFSQQVLEQKKVYFTQAVDLINESHLVFTILSESKHVTKSDKKKYKLYTILSMLFMIKFKLLNRGNVVILTELFKSTRNSLRNIKNLKKQEDIILKNILTQYYYYYRGQFLFGLQNYQKALKSLLLSLNLASLNRKTYSVKDIQDESKIMEYDIKMAKKALKLIQKIVIEQDIPFSKSQYELIEKDIELIRVVRRSSSEKFLSKLNTFFLLQILFS